MTWVWSLGLLAVLGAAAWWKYGQANIFSHRGTVYKRRPDGSFVNAAGNLAAGSVLGALTLAHEERRRDESSRSDSGDASGSNECEEGSDADGGD